jgi:hypothetical protein
MSRYLSGLLSQVQKADYERHLELCPACQAKIKEQQKLEASLKAFGRALQPSNERINESIDQIMVKIHQPETLKKVTEQNKPHWNDWFNLSKPLTWGPALAGILLALVAAWMVMQPASLTPVKIARLVGDSPRVQSVGETAIHTLNKGSKLKVGDSVTTGIGTRLAMTLGNSGKIWLEQNSKLKVLPGTGNALELESGRIWIELDKKQAIPFKVKTPEGIVTALGTEFVIQILPDDKMMVACTKHSVAVENGYGRVVVDSGKKTYVSSHKAPGAPMPITGFVDWRKAIDYYGNMTPEEQQKVSNEYMKKGLEASNNKNYGISWKYYNLVAYLNPWANRAFFSMGWNSWKLGQYVKAKNEFNTVYIMNPNDIDNLYYYCNTLLESMDYIEALNKSNKLISKKPNLPEAWVFLGEAYLGLDDIENARNSYIHAIELNKQINSRMKDHLHAGLAEIARLQKNYELTEKELSAINFDKTEEGFPFVVAARYYQDTGKTQSEIIAWEGYLSRRPDSGFSEEARERIRILKKGMNEGI